MNSEFFERSGFSKPFLPLHTKKSRVKFLATTVSEDPLPENFQCDDPESSTYDPLVCENSQDIQCDDPESSTYDPLVCEKSQTDNSKKDNNMIVVYIFIGIILLIVVIVVGFVGLGKYLDHKDDQRAEKEKFMKKYPDFYLQAKTMNEDAHK
jgi:hypothetical protein